ncbi:TadE family type IV pilus minor pilin [Amycolatopsis arida]|uniref:TadE family type IV pilus minor pilin n=1 Tax=Amycolatopsis arida TaxID=587909 RepID=UPI002444FD15|nr:TadE family type IV pilus minor pilin [Amycolatopsis arida]
MEAAIGLSALIAVFVLVLGAAVALVQNIRCADAAREAARLTARGDRSSAAAAVRSIAPAGARLDVREDGHAVRVEVVAPGIWPLPGLVPRGRAYAVLEPRVAEPGTAGGAEHAGP